MQHRIARNRIASTLAACAALCTAAACDNFGFVNPSISEDFATRIVRGGFGGGSGGGYGTGGSQCIHSYGASVALPGSLTRPPGGPARELASGGGSCDEPVYVSVRLPAPR